MLIPQFLAWAEEASAGERAEAAFGLARAFLYADLDAFTLGEAERALTIMLDDPSTMVRRSLAEAFATAVDVPRHLLAALAADRSDIAAIVLERSPILDDADLIDAVAVGDALAQSAVARRARLSASVAGALAEVGDLEAALDLCRNNGAELSRFAIERLISRFSQDGRIREAIGRRNDLNAEMRHALVMASAQTLTSFVIGCAWMSAERATRLLQDAGDRATIAIAVGDDLATVEPGLRGFASYLRTAGYLTPALMLRALLSRHNALFEAALCELSGRTEERIAGLVRNCSGLGFAALYKSVGLPLNLLPVFRAAILAGREIDATHQAGESGRLDRRMVTTVIRACEAISSRDDFRRLSALLRRFEVEAARDEVRPSDRVEIGPAFERAPAPLALDFAPRRELELPVAA